MVRSYCISTTYELDPSILMGKTVNWFVELNAVVQRVTELPNTIIDHLIIPYVGYISEAALDLVQQMKELYRNRNMYQKHYEYITAEEKYINRVHLGNTDGKVELAFWMLDPADETFRRKIKYLVNSCVYTDVLFLEIRCEQGRSCPFIQDWLELLRLLNYMFPNLIVLKLQQCLQNRQNLQQKINYNLLVDNLVEFIRKLNIPIFILQDDSPFLANFLESHLNNIFAQQGMNSILLFQNRLSIGVSQTDNNKGIFLVSNSDCALIPHETHCGGRL